MWREGRRDKGREGETISIRRDDSKGGGRVMLYDNCTAVLATAGYDNSLPDVVVVARKRERERERERERDTQTKKLTIESKLCMQ